MSIEHYITHKCSIDVYKLPNCTPSPELIIESNLKANNTNGAPGAEDCNKGNEHKECEGMIVDMVAAEKENSFQV